MKTAGRGLNTRTPTLVPICLLLYLKEENGIFVLQSLFHEHNLDEQPTAFCPWSAGESQIQLTALPLFVDQKSQTDR